MKEYLVSYNGNFTLEHLPNPIYGAIEIPHGADILAKANDGITTFWGKEYQWEINGEICRNIKSEDPEFTFKEWKKKWNAEILWQRNPIKPKEYLFKGIDGTYKVVDHDCQGRAIEIPEGAVKFFVNNEGTAHFVSLSGQFMANYDIEKGVGYWYDPAVSMDYYQSVMGGALVWSRHTQPEELPFVNDGDDDKCDSKLGNFVVDETLQERQSQYGEFKDVANTTQYLLQVLSNDKMSDVQLESLHMICSKLARIAHGDPNHIDSWHDIAGYATLVVKDIS